MLSVLNVDECCSVLHKLLLLLLLLLIGVRVKEEDDKVKINAHKKKKHLCFQTRSYTYIKIQDKKLLKAILFLSFYLFSI